MERGLRCVNGGGGALVLGWRLKKLLVVMVVLGDIFSLEFAVFLQSLALVSENCVAAGLRSEKNRGWLILSKNLGRRSRPSPKSLLIETQKHPKQDGHVGHHQRHPPAHHARCVPPMA